MITFTEFLDRIISEGIEAATADYTKECQKEHLAGSIAGFEACRGKSPQELVELFGTATKQMNEEFFLEHELRNPKISREKGYWYYRCYQIEIEWVLNVVSAMLVNEGQQPLLSYLPTGFGYMKAAEIIGAKA